MCVCVRACVHTSVCARVGRLVVVARGLYLARHLFTLFIYNYNCTIIGLELDVVLEEKLHGHALS